jgi:hypothetical protein
MDVEFEMPDSTSSINSRQEITPQSTVVIGGAQITVQQLQQIYNELTGKSESINKYYNEPIRLELDDVGQLHQRIIQTWEQYNIVSSSCSFTVYYLKNTKDQFNTFQRFKLQIGSGSEPVESILLKYEFLVILPNLTKPQTYSISIRVVSRLALERRMREGTTSPFVPRFLRLMGRSTASVEIMYVDYAVARNFLSTIDDWLKTIPCSIQNKTMKFLQCYSYWVPRIGKFATATIVTLIVASILPRFVNAKETSLFNLAEFFLWSALGVYVAYTLAGWSTFFAETAIDSWSEISYIKLNRGDEIEIAKIQSENRAHLLRGICGGVGMVLVDIAAKLTATLAVGYIGLP